MDRSKLTPFVKKKICELVELGVPDRHAAHAVGVTPQTFINWKHRGENYNPNNGTNGDEKYLSLLNGITEAKAKFVKKNVARIDKSAEKDTDKAQWLLERRIPEDFAKREVLQVEESRVLIALRDRFSTLRNDVAKETLCDTPKLETERKQLTTGGDRE